LWTSEQTEKSLWEPGVAGRLCRSGRACSGRRRHDTRHAGRTGSGRSGEPGPRHRKSALFDDWECPGPWNLRFRPGGCLSELFLNGLIDRAARFSAGQRHFVVVPAAESASGQDIVATQADIDNLMATKGAVNVAVEVLLESVGCNWQDIRRFYAAREPSDNIFPWNRPSRSASTPICRVRRWSVWATAPAKEPGRCFCPSPSAGKRKHLPPGSLISSLIPLYGQIQKQQISTPHRHRSLPKRQRASAGPPPGALASGTTPYLAPLENRMNLPGSLYSPLFTTLHTTFILLRL